LFVLLDLGQFFVVLLSRDTQLRLGVKNVYFCRIKGIFMSRARLPISFRKMLQEEGYSEIIIEKLWEWYDYSEKKGVASF
jgi:hypothetical protein